METKSLYERLGGYDAIAAVTVFMRHAAAALEKFAVPATERGEVLAFLTSLQGDIVERASL